jgi:transposase InsO family protein
MKYRFIQAHRTEYRLTGLCRTLGVSRSGYYAWRQRSASARATANARLLEQIQQLHRQTKARYGALKLWRALQLAGLRCGRHRVARLRRQHGLIAQRVRRFRMTIDRHEFAPPAPTRLQQVFVAPAVNRIWAGDLTAIATRVGWLYLAVVLDVYSRRVVGWAMSAKAGSARRAPGAAHGHDASPPAAWSHSSLRSRGPLYQHRLPALADSAWAGEQHESQRQLL